MSQSVHRIPNPTPEAVNLWLKQVKPSDLHDVGWITVNKKFHGLTRSVRPFINEHYDTPEERAAAFDGLTLALMTLAHFGDIEKLEKLFNETVRLEKGTKQRPHHRPHADEIHGTNHKKLD